MIKFEKNPTTTLGDIFPNAQGNRITIKIATAKGEEIVNGVFAKTKEDIMVIGRNYYKPDTPVLEVMTIAQNQRVLSCNLCLCGPCNYKDGQIRNQCLEVIRDVIGRKAE